MSQKIRLSPMNGMCFEKSVSLATKLLEDGHIIAVPTNTVYGLAVLSQNDSAIRKLYDLKARDVSKPISISVADVKDVHQWCQPTVGTDLLSHLLSDAVTVVFKRTAALNVNLNPGHDLVGIRLANHHFVHRLCAQCGPICLTSANISSEASCLTVDEFRHLWPHLSAVIDVGPLGQLDPMRLGSTVVDLSVSGAFGIIRNGCALDRTVDVLQRRYGLKRL